VPNGRAARGNLDGRAACLTIDRTTSVPPGNTDQKTVGDCRFLVESRRNGKWWLLPILLVLGVFGILLALASTTAAPSIYTMRTSLSFS
jgi:hypothetical protein